MISLYVVISIIIIVGIMIYRAVANENYQKFKNLIRHALELHECELVEVQKASLLDKGPFSFFEFRFDKPFATRMPERQIFKVTFVHNEKTYTEYCKGMKVYGEIFLKERRVVFKPRLSEIITKG